MGVFVPLPRPLLSDGAFVRLWLAGGLSNGSLWLESLAAALFTFEATGSTWAVAVVSAARATPLLLFGLGVGIASDAWNRSTIVMVGLALSAVSAASIALISTVGTAQPWQVAVAAFISGSAYCTEFPARRRVIAESAGPARVDAAVAVDNLTGYAARCLGPLLGGLIFDHLGLGGSFAVSALGNLTGAVLIAATPHRQSLRQLDLRSWRGDLRVATAFVRRSKPVLSLLAVTMTMNLFGFSYATLVTPIGLRTLGLDATATGILAAAEPAGAFAAGLALTRFAPPGSRLAALMGGCALLAAGLLATAGLGSAGVAFPLLCLALAAGGYRQCRLLQRANQSRDRRNATRPEKQSDGTDDRVHRILAPWHADRRGVGPGSAPARRLRRSADLRFFLSGHDHRPAGRGRTRPWLTRVPPRPSSGLGRRA